MGRTASLLIAIALCVSCRQVAEGRQTFRDLLVLRDRITAEFGEKNVDVTIATGNHLTVRFIDSPFGARPYAEKQERADAVAAFVAKRYKRPLSSVSLQFVSNGVRETFIGRLPAR